MSAVVIDTVECFEVKANGPIVDKNSARKVTAAGDTLSIKSTGGVGTTMRSRAYAVDAARNVAQQTCEVLVGNLGPGK